MNARRARCVPAPCLKDHDSQGFGVRSLELVEESIANVHYQSQFQWQYNHKVIHSFPFLDPEAAVIPAAGDASFLPVEIFAEIQEFRSFTL